MKRPNGSGGVRKLTGKRRKPYQAVISNGYKFDGEKFVQNQISVGVYRTRKEALEALTKYTQNIFNHDKRSMTFGDIYEEIRWDLKPSMQRALKTAYNKIYFIEDKRIVDIRKPELDMISECAAGMSSSYQNNIKILVRSVFEYALENDIVMKD